MKRFLMVAMIVMLAVMPVFAQEEVTQVTAVLETQPSPGDGATAPAIWLHPYDLNKSLILGADDNEGLGVYDLAGQQIAFLELGSVLATDIRYNFPLGRERLTLIAAAIEDASVLYLYTVDPESLELEPLGQLETGIPQSAMCLFHSPSTDRFYVFVASGDGDVEQYMLDGSTGTITSRLIRSFNVGSETEGCAADDDFRAVYISEGGVALWRYGAEPETGNNRAIVDLLMPRGNITEEIEGVTILSGADGEGYLMVSNEKNHSFLMYERRGANAYVGQLGIGENDAADNVTEPTGFAAVSLPINETFPGGLFVTSDDRNSNPTDDNNFKVVSWADVESALGLPAITAFDLRESGTSEFVSSAPAVIADLETAPVPSGIDAADDPAIWIHPTDSALSTIIGTDKTSGLVLYDFEGNLLQTLDIGRVNNVDLRYNFHLGDQSVAVVTTTNRTMNSLEIFTVNPETRMLENAAARLIESAVEEVYGICMYVSPVTGSHYVFVNSADTGEVEQYELAATDDGKIDAVVVRTFVVGSQTEGCVVDDANQALYIGEEGVGFYRYDAEPNATDERRQIDNTTLEGNLTADVEGIALYATSDGGGYLIVSSQGSSEFAIYERTGENAYLGSFTVIESDSVDGISGTDGIDVTNFAIGEAFPDGVFIAQDDYNISPDENQNFKLVSWSRIAEALNLEVDTSFDPRTVGAAE